LYKDLNGSSDGCDYLNPHAFKTYGPNTFTSNNSLTGIKNVEVRFTYWGGMEIICQNYISFDEQENYQVDINLTNVEHQIFSCTYN